MHESRLNFRIDQHNELDKVAHGTLVSDLASQQKIQSTVNPNPPAGVGLMARNETLRAICPAARSSAHSWCRTLQTATACFSNLLEATRSRKILVRVKDQ